MISDPDGNVFSFQFPLLTAQKRVAHSIYTRFGGVSNPPYNSLNIGYNTGDIPENVSINLQIIKKSFGADQLIYMNQGHGRNILILRQKDLWNPQPGPIADAMITDIPGLALMVKQADCQAVILYDPENEILANVHCGWRGNRINILGSVVERMNSEFGCLPSRLKAAISPSLGPCCAEFTSYMDIFPQDFKRFMVQENYFDLWEISKMQLLETGIMESNLQIARMCTKCNTDLFYSYRAEAITGRFATVAMLTH